MWRVRPCKRKKSGVMNKWESAYAERLEMAKKAGEVVSYHYEAVRLTLGFKTTYTPDFMVVTWDEIQFHEVKGQKYAAGMAKFKVAASLFPGARWVMVEKTKTGWNTIMDL